MIRGTTTLIAHIGYPTETFKAPTIYNSYQYQLLRGLRGW